MRRFDALLTHGLNANGKSDLDLTGPDLVGNHGHSHESAGAKPIDHLNGDAFGETSSEGSTTGVVDRVGRQNGADTNVPYDGRVNVGVGDCLLYQFWHYNSWIQDKGHALNISSMSSSVLYGEVEH